jgi:hypothetical protein
MTTVDTHSPANEVGKIQTVCLALPLLPGVSSTEREEMLSCWRGERAEEHSASRQRHGITRESVWIQDTPNGDIEVILIESPDIATALLGIATSQEAHDVWFRNHVSAMHGVDLTQGMSLPDLVLDYRAARP